MSQFSEAKNYVDLQRFFDALVVRLQSSRDKLSCPNTDARHVALFGMQTVIGGFAMGFNSMIYNRTQEQVIESFGVNNLTADGARRMLEDTWKNGMMTLFHFKVDSLFQNLLRALGLYKERGFEGMMRKLLAEVGIEGKFIRDVLLTMGYLRNTLHNNGIHRGPALSLKFHDLEFSFVQDKKITCASWGHLFAAMTECVEGIDAILATGKIKALPPPIEDHYMVQSIDDWKDPIDYTKKL